jgi:anti-anti-sigma regulatory factor/HAMP domain-containing protein
MTPFVPDDRAQPPLPRRWPFTIRLPLHLMLVLVFLGLTLPAIGVLAFFSLAVAQPQIRLQISANLKRQARSSALDVGNLLAQQIQTLRVLGDDMKDDLEGAAAPVDAADPAAIHAQLRGLDQHWRVVPDTDPLVQARLTNVIADALRTYRTRFPENATLFVTDRYGALVAATDRIDQYAYAEEPWWQLVRNKGSDVVYISQPEVDPGNPALAVRIAVPISRPGSSEILGVLQTTYHLNMVANSLVAVGVGQTGRAQLFLPDAQVLAVDGDRFLPADPAILRQLQGATTDSIDLLYDGRASIASWAPIATTRGESAVANLGWALIVSQDRTEAFRPNDGFQQAIIVVSLSTMILTGLLAVGVARVISHPIVRLRDAAQQIASGNLTSRVLLQRGDELGMLAQSFNQMAVTIQQRTQDLEAQYHAAQTGYAQAEVAHTEIAAQLATIEAQRDVIRTMSVPILPLTHRALVMPLVGVIDAERAVTLLAALLKAIEQQRAHIVILDVTGVPLIDTQVAQVLLHAINGAQLLGAQTVVVGVRPELAQTIVGLGVDLRHVVTRADLQSAVSYAMQTAHTSQ